MENLNYLKSLAYQKLYAAGICVLPVNPYSLSDILKVQLKRKSSYFDEWKKIVAPRTNGDIFSLAGLGEYTVYYNDDVENINYLVNHELARYMLNCSNEIAANNENIELLTIFIMSPPCIIKSLNIESVSDISVLCGIPAHKVRKYISEITETDDSQIINFENKIDRLFSNFIKTYKNSSLLRAARDKFINYSSVIVGEDLKSVKPNKDSEKSYRIVHSVYLEEGIGPYYHEHECDLIKNKINIMETSIKNAELANYKPCPKCIKKLM